MLHITGHGTWVRHRDYFTGDYTSGDYDKLLDAGIERSIAQIQQLAALDVPERRIYLSGGRDSRQVMAMVAAAGVADKFTICSTNPRTWPGDAYSRKVVWADFNVSNVIRKKYGMKWAADGEFAGHPANFEEVLQFWQSAAPTRCSASPAGGSSSSRWTAGSRCAEPAARPTGTSGAPSSRSCPGTASCSRARNTSRTTC